MSNNSKKNRVPSWFRVGGVVHSGCKQGEQLYYSFPLFSSRKRQIKARPASDLDSLFAAGMYYATRGVQIAFRAKLETKRIIIYKLHDEINYFPERKIMCQDLIWPPTFNCKIKFSISLIFHKENTKEINAQSIRKLNKFNFQWTKTLYQDNLNNIAFFFTFFKGYKCN